VEPKQEARTFKDPEKNDIIITGEDLDLLEAQKKVLDIARHHGDAFTIRVASRALDAMKDALSVNASFVDATPVEENPSFLGKGRHIPQLEEEGSAHGAATASRRLDVPETETSPVHTWTTPFGPSLETDPVLQATDAWLEEALPFPVDDELLPFSTKTQEPPSPLPTAHRAPTTPVALKGNKPTPPLTPRGETTVQGSDKHPLSG
jgi:hypothetical protein